MSKKRLIVVGGLCVLVGGVLGSCYLAVYQVRHPKPWKMGTVTAGDKQITISLFCGSTQRALIEPYNGVFRILEVAQREKPTLYYDLPDTITDDRCRMEVYWYPTNNLILIKDTAFAAFAREFRSECVLDLNQNILFTAIRQGDHITHMAKLSVPMHQLAFPKPAEGSRAAHAYSGDVASLAQDPTRTITIGDEDAKPIDAPWTSSPGVLIGVIASKE